MPEQPKRHRAPRRVPLIWAAAALAVLIALFMMLDAKQRHLVVMRAEELARAKEMKTALEVRQNEMIRNIERAQTDEFVANEARTRYGYLSDGEIRFVITNPSVLWGPEGPPEGWVNPNTQLDGK